MQEHVLDLPRLFHLHEGQGPAGRPLHHQPDLRNLRRQPRHLLLLRAEHGLRREAAAPGRVDREPGRGRRVHVRPQHLPGKPRRRGLLREDGLRNQPRRAGQGREHTGPARGRPRLPHHRGHHALAEPVHRGVLPRGAAGQPGDPRNVLPHGGPARPSLHALPGRRGHGGHDPADDGLHHPAHAVRGVHEEGRPDARRPLRLLLRGPARVRAGGAAAHPAGLLGLASRTRSSAISTTRT